MENSTMFKLNRCWRALQVALSTAVALMLLAAVLWGLQGATPVLADPGMFYVDGATGSDDSDCSDPGHPCATIGYALTQAGNGDEILVAEGTYVETLDVHGNPLTLRGGYTLSGAVWSRQGGETIVDANGADSSVFNIHPENDVTVEGFTVQGADHVSDVGGGFNINGATVVISDTVIHDNSSIGGAGVYVENSPGAENMMVSLINSTLVGNASEGTAGLVLGGGGPIQLAIENTVFTGNTGNDILHLGNGPFVIIGGQVSENSVTGSYAIGIGGSGSGTISGTEIVSNTSSAMRIWSPDNMVSADNLTIRGNTGGGIVSSGVLTLTNSLVENNSGGDWFLITSVNEDAPGTESLLLDGCTIRGNSDVPGVLGLSGHARVRDTVIADNDNAGINGDVVYIWHDAVVDLVNVLLADNVSARPVVNGNAPSSTISLMNVTLANNRVTNSPILAGDGTWAVTNSVVWGNSVPGDMNMVDLGFGIFSVTYSDIEGGYDGAGNLDLDPMFVDSAGGDYRLGVGSPCIDKGTSAGAPVADIAGTARDAAPDIGAYEWTGFRIFLPMTYGKPGS